MSNLRKLLLPVVGALALAIGAAGTVSAATFGSIPNGAVNEGLVPIYGSSPRDGWYGADLYLFGGGGTASITVTFMGNEAGFINDFIWDSSSIFSTGTVTNNTWNVSGVEASMTFNNVADGLLDFGFTINSGADSVFNGANPDDSAGGAGVNYFVTFSNPAASSSTTWVDLWLDDAGAGPDDNHDDIAIRLEVTGGSFAVPIPAAVWLFGSGLLGLVGMARRKKA